MLNYETQSAIWKISSVGKKHTTMLGEMLLHKCQCARTLSCTSIQSLDELDLFAAAPSGMNSWNMTPRYSKRFLSPCLFSDSARIPWLLVMTLTHVAVHCEDHIENVTIHHLGCS